MEALLSSLGRLGFGLWSDFGLEVMAALGLVEWRCMKPCMGSCKMFNDAHNSLMKIRLSLAFSEHSLSALNAQLLFSIMLICRDLMISNIYYPKNIVWGYHF